MEKREIAFIATIVAAYVLMRKIKNEFTKEKSNIELIRNLIGYFCIFLAFALVLEILFGIVAVLVSLFIANEQAICGKLHSIKERRIMYA